MGEYRALLSSGPDERQVQAFFERYPALVPGGLTPGGSTGHYPLHCALITQPVLPGFHSRLPDLMWIATDSGTWYPTLIEIESPGKRLFTKRGVPTAAFTQARTQLAQWLMVPKPNQCSTVRGVVWGSAGMAPRQRLATSYDFDLWAARGVRDITRAVEATSLTDAKS